MSRMTSVKNKIHLNPYVTKNAHLSVYFLLQCDIFDETAADEKTILKVYANLGHFFRGMMFWHEFCFKYLHQKIITGSEEIPPEKS